MKLRVVWLGGWMGSVHWADPEGVDIFSILSRALKKPPLPTGSSDAPRLTALMSVHERRASLEARECEVMDLERFDAPSPLPTPDRHGHAGPMCRAHPTYRSLDEHLRGELRILLADEARRWIKEDVSADRTGKAHVAIARRSVVRPK